MAIGILASARDGLRGPAALFLVATGLFWMSLYFYVPILAPYVEHRGSSLEIVGLVIGSYGLAQLLLRLPLGLLSDVLGRRKPFLAVGFAASILSSVLFLVADGAWSLTGARFLSGISACAWVAFTVLFQSYFPPSMTLRAIAGISMTNSLAILGATSLGGWLADAYGWTAPFWAALCAGLAGAALLPWLREEVADPEAGEAAGVTADTTPGRLAATLARLRRAWRDPRLRSASWVAALGQYTLFATSFGFFPTYAFELGASKTELGVLTLLSALSYMLGTAASGRLAATGFEVRAANMVSYGVLALPIFALPWVGTLAFLNLVAALSGFLRGVSFPMLMNAAIADKPARDKATSMGFFQATYGIGMFVGPVISGLVAQRWGMTGVFVSSSGVLLLTAMAASTLPTPGRPQSTEVFSDLVIRNDGKARVTGIR